MRTMFCILRTCVHALFMFALIDLNNCRILVINVLPFQILHLPLLGFYF